MARPTKAETLAILERRNRVAEQYMRGVSQAHIALTEGVDRSTISYDLTKIRKDWQERRAADYSVRLDEEVARINRLEVIATEAWERSCQDAEERRAEIVKGRVDKEGVPLPDLQRTSKVERGQVGDPRFLDRIAWCIETRLKLMGALKADVSQANIAVTIVGGIDLAAVTGQKPGLPHEPRQLAPSNN